MSCVAFALSDSNDTFGTEWLFKSFSFLLQRQSARNSDHKDLIQSNPLSNQHIVKLTLTKGGG